MNQIRPKILSFNNLDNQIDDDITAEKPFILKTVHEIEPQKVKRRKHKNRNQQHRNDFHVKHVTEDGYSLPLELRPVIDVILSYGRKTNSLGTLGAAKILTDISTELKKLGLDQTNNAVKELVKQADRTAENIRLNFENAYDD